MGVEKVLAAVLVAVLVDRGSGFAYGTTGEWVVLAEGESAMDGADAGNWLVRNETTFNSLWTASVGGEVPVVDFETKSVVVLYMGQRPSSGYQISIAGWSLMSGILSIEVLETVPGDDCSVLTILTHPYSFVLLPVVADAASFETTIEANDECA